MMASRKSLPGGYFGFFSLKNFPAPADNTGKEVAPFYE